MTILKSLNYENLTHILVSYLNIENGAIFFSIIDHLSAKTNIAVLPRSIFSERDDVNLKLHVASSVINQ